MKNIIYIPQYILGKLRKLYFMALPETKYDYKKSRIYYTLSDLTTQSIAQLSGGTYIVMLMAYIGFSDSEIGIIISLSSLAALFQLISMPLTKKIKKYKLYISITALFRLLFGLVYFIPIMNISKDMKVIFFVVCYFSAQIFVQIGTPPLQDWIASLVPSRLRGKYFAKKESVVIIFLALIMLLAGIMLDYFKVKGILIGFGIMGIVLFAFAIINVVFLSLMKEPKITRLNPDGKEIHGRLLKKQNNQKDTDVFDNYLKSFIGVFKEKKFVKVFILSCMWMGTFFFVAPYNNNYLIKELNLPYTFIMVVTFVGSVFRMIIIPKWGKYGDKYGMSKTLKYAYLSLGIYHLLMAFTVLNNAYFLYIISTIFSTIGWGFATIGLLGVQLDYIESRNRTLCLSIISSISGLFGFLMSIAGGTLLNYLQKSNLVILHTKILAQQVLNLIGFLMILVIFIYIKFIIQKEKVIENKKDGVSI